MPRRTSTSTSSSSTRTTPSMHTGTGTATSASSGRATNGSDSRPRGGSSSSGGPSGRAADSASGADAQAHERADTDADTPASKLATDALRSPCPVACSLDVVGDRWTLLVIRDLFAGKSRFGEFLEAPEHIPTNILAERLKRLQMAGLIEAVPYSERPPRHGYALTPRGRALGPVVDALAEWGLAQFPGTRRPSRLARA